VIRSHVDEEISVGDYILSGGEVPAIILIDSIMRFLPGTLGHQESAYNESFSEGLLESPQFTRPREQKEWLVPEVLLSGDHKRIEQWRRRLSLLKTAQLRPELLIGDRLIAELKLAIAWAEKESVFEMDTCGLSAVDIADLREKWFE
jgi:tRNA (guanine37-N1)-methyltransferase